MNSIKSLLERQHHYFEQMGVISVDERILTLKKLKVTIKKYEVEIIDALSTDLGKNEFEAYSTEVGFIYDTISSTLKSIRKWAKPKTVKSSAAQLPGKSMIYPSAYGTVLIIGPFNYPFQLVVEPLIGAIAGGNTIIIKPSEYAKATEAILEKIINEVFCEDYIAVVTGDYRINQALLDLPFDYIFFTGSVRVGKIVMEKASRHLIPVTLELGGKSPVIVDDTANLKMAAQRIVWGKFSNAGQTCVAPDYALVHANVYDAFIEQLQMTITTFYGTDIKHNSEFGRIISRSHTERLNNILKQDASKIICGGDVDVEERYVSPTLMKNVTLEDKVMEDELFGPILPLIRYESEAEIKMYMKAHPKPLALYVFSENKTFVEKLLRETTFGGGCVNDTITHVASSFMPFGGVGTSGIGRYHGKWSFETFTYEKSIVKKSSKINISLVFPPYKDKIKLIRKIMK